MDQGFSYNPDPAIFVIFKTTTKIKFKKKFFCLLLYIYIIFQR
jgi:hypothetical protein